MFSNHVELIYFPKDLPGISNSEVEYLVQMGVDPTVAKINLTLAKKQLSRKDRPPNWETDHIEYAECEYKRFLTLFLWNPRIKHTLVPTVLIDIVWHEHVTDTWSYYLDCQRVFGRVLHHFPYFGDGGPRNNELYLDAKRRTKQLYFETFGVPMVRSMKQDISNIVEYFSMVEN